jgi:hypothetical protein
MTNYFCTGKQFGCGTKGDPEEIKISESPQLTQAIYIKNKNKYTDATVWEA